MIYTTVGNSFGWLCPLSFQWRWRMPKPWQAELLNYHATLNRPSPERSYSSLFGTRRETTHRYTGKPFISYSCREPRFSLSRRCIDQDSLTFVCVSTKPTYAYVYMYSYVYEIYPFNPYLRLLSQLYPCPLIFVNSGNVSLNRIWIR